MSKHVVLYSTSTCEYCWQVREYLKTNQVPFVEIDTDASADAAREVQQWAGDFVVPVVVIADETRKQAVIGYDRLKLDKALKG